METGVVGTGVVGSGFLERCGFQQHRFGSQLSAKLGFLPSACVGTTPCPLTVLLLYPRMLIERERDCLLKSLGFHPGTPSVKVFARGRSSLAAPISFVTLETAEFILCPNQ